MLMNPLKNLKGKLNHLHITKTFVMRVVQTANSVPLVENRAQSSLDSESVETILSLSQPNPSLNLRQFHKLMFDVQVHTQSSKFFLPSTIYDELSPSQTKISLLISRYCERLNTRQLLFLNYAFRQQINYQFPCWNNLHLNLQSPSKNDLQMLPLLNTVCQEFDLRTAPKKIVMKQIALVKSQANPATV